jgi:hypothetical protein
LTLVRDASPDAITARTFVPGAVIFAVAFLYRLPDGASLVNDHFMHFVWGRQMLWGRLPIRDSVTLGMPLQTGLSAAAESIVGYRLLSEALIFSTAFAAAAVLTFVLARRASGSFAIAIAATALEIAIAPRTYSYPKIISYAVGILLLWRYIDAPSTRRVVHVGVAAVIAFYLRHDHGVYLGVVALGVIALRHRPAWNVATQHAGILAFTCVVLTAPYLVYIQAYGGLGGYIEDLRLFSAREHSKNPFIWPAWPLPSAGSVARWTSAEDRSVQVGIRWNPNASDEARRQAAAVYHLRVPATGSLESGRFALSDPSRANANALINDAAVEDTAGIDRVTGEIHVPGWYVGPIRLLEGLDRSPASAALLFFVFLGISLFTAIALLRNGASVGLLGPWERVKIGAVLFIAVLTFVGFVREALDARIADAVVAPLLLGAWLSARWLKRGTPSAAWSRMVRVTVLVAVLIPVGRSVVVAGGVDARLRPAEPYGVIWQRLVVSPPFDTWPAQGSAQYRIVRYVRECTGASEPLLVLWFAPEYYYYADRPFAGRMGGYMNGYYSSDENQRKNRAALERDRPPIAILEAGRELNDLAGHPSALSYLADNYHQIGELPAADGTVVRVFGRNDRQATSVHADLGWPCYR